jgi:hypothetical protein
MADRHDHHELSVESPDVDAIHGEGAEEREKVGEEEEEEGDIEYPRDPNHIRLEDVARPQPAAAASADPALDRDLRLLVLSYPMQKQVSHTPHGWVMPILALCN